MELGPRIIVLILSAALWEGAKDSKSFNFEAAYQTILIANAVNWCLRLINEPLEEKIMEIVSKIEERLLAMLLGGWNVMRGCLVSCTGGVGACLKGALAWWRGNTFPPVIDI